MQGNLESHQRSGGRRIRSAADDLVVEACTDGACAIGVDHGMGPFGMKIDSLATKRSPSKVRYFIRFGDVPEGKRSTMWTAPNVYMQGRTGQTLPGLSAYHAKRRGKRWELVTDDINVGSGIASLFTCFQRSLEEPDFHKVFLLKGVATTWKNMTAMERREFTDWYPGKGAEGFEILGTDGEPLVRDLEIVSLVSVTDLVCKMIDFPDEWDGFLGAS